MEHIVYILGAGFSAPLGLPVMSNFIEKSVEMQESNPDLYASFNEIFELRNRLFKAKNLHTADLDNIEEVLSMLEMRVLLDKTTQNSKLLDQFSAYIKAVIQYYTPKMSLNTEQFPANWVETFFNHKAIPQNLYVFFIASLLHLTMVDQRTGDSDVFVSMQDVESSTTYAVVTLNYDTIFETFMEYLMNFSWKAVQGMTIQSTHERPLPIPKAVPFFKLHGSINSNIIVTPTRNKSLHSELLPDWQEAYSHLKRATQIRILGYSLPNSDAYIPYLLKAASVDSQRIRNIDVLCMDDDAHTIEHRYKELYSSSKLRFRNGNIIFYLTQNQQMIDNMPSKIQINDETWQGVKFDKLEAAHSFFFGGLYL